MCNSVKFETGGNLLPVLKIVTRTAHSVNRSHCCYGMLPGVLSLIILFRLKASMGVTPSIIQLVILMCSWNEDHNRMDTVQSESCVCVCS